MTYELIKMGSLYLDGKPQPVPQVPIKEGDIPKYNGTGSIVIGNTVEGKAITWVKPEGMNLLVANRAILCDVNMRHLSSNGFLHGKEISIDGRPYLCRLLKVGLSRKVPNEWDKCLDIVGEDNDIWHYISMCFWGSEQVPGATLNYACRGGYSARYWGSTAMWFSSNGHGFRPVLEPLLPKCA